MTRTPVRKRTFLLKHPTCPVSEKKLWGQEFTASWPGPYAKGATWFKLDQDLMADPKQASATFLWRQNREGAWVDPIRVDLLVHLIWSDPGGLPQAHLHAALCRAGSRGMLQRLLSPRRYFDWQQYDDVCLNALPVDIEVPELLVTAQKHRVPLHTPGFDWKDEAALRLLREHMRHAPLSRKAVERGARAGKLALAARELAAGIEEVEEENSAHEEARDHLVKLLAEIPVLAPSPHTIWRTTSLVCDAIGQEVAARYEAMLRVNADRKDMFLLARREGLRLRAQRE